MVHSCVKYPSLTERKKQILMLLSHRITLEKESRLQGVGYAPSIKNIRVALDAMLKMKHLSLVLGGLQTFSP